MGRNSKIEWTHHTFNPWWGCTKLTPACDHCYAERMARRFGFSIWGSMAPRRFFGARYWAEPLKWDRKAGASGERHRVFCGSMCDVMEYWGGLNPWRARLWGLIEATPHLDWLLLTKRPENFGRLLPAEWLKAPRPNVWLMTTVESRTYLWRIKKLLEIPAVVHGVSYEPALAAVDFKPFLPHWICDACGAFSGGYASDGLHPDNGCIPGRQGFASYTGSHPPRHKLNWLVFGGESGPNARPSHPDWFRQTVRDCRAAGVPCVFKQWGEWLPRDQESPNLLAGDGEGFDRLGKKSAGRLLDGREYMEFPQGMK